MPEKRYPGHLPRLQPSAYQGTAMVHWTLTTFDRQPLPLSSPLHYDFQLVLLHTLARNHLCCPVYCLMQDHLHLILAGLQTSSDQQRAMRFFNTHLEPKIAPARFQPQSHDHVLRPEDKEQDAFQNAVGYIKNNPVRAGLVENQQDWPYMGAMFPGYPALDIHQDTYQDLMWRLIEKLRSKPM